MIPDVDVKRLKCVVLAAAAFAAAAWGWGEAMPAVMAARIFGF